MFVEEALWIRDLFDELGPRSGTVIDLGSSTEEYRRLVQPHIDYHVFRPLRQKGVTVVHVDAKPAAGVDVVIDLTRASLDGVLSPADAVIATSLLEHVTDRDLLVRHITGLTLPGGLAIVSVPRVYPFHPDPIDTMYRPTQRELEELWRRDFDVLRSETLYVEKWGRPMPLVVRMINRALRAIGRPAFRRSQLVIVALRRRGSVSTTPPSDG